MKNRINILLAAVLVMAVLPGCKKYLEVENPSTISQEAVFNSASYTNGAVVGVYAMLIGDNGYGNRISCLYPQTADDFKTSGSYSPLDRRGISMYGASPGNSELLAPFRQLYKGIERANICIKYIPLSSLYTSGTADQQKQMRKYYAEALTLRAQFYHELIRNWGDVPFHKVPASDLTETYLPKEDRDTIYNQLLEDLRIAAELMPWRTEAGNEGVRLSKGPVKALRARIALARGGYSLRRAESKYGQVMARPADYLTYYKIARDECAELMARRDQHDLNPVYEDLFKTLNTGTRYDPKYELMFEVGAFGGNASTDSKLGYYNGLRINASARFGQGGGGILAIPTYFYEFDSVGDCRRDVTINAFEIDANSKKILNPINNMTDGKYRRSWTTITGTSQNLAINWPIIRFADVLLMFAEADNELNNGPTAAAKSAYEEVRKRAFAGYLNRMGTTPSDKAGFFDAIVKERLLEFGGEGMRKFDLIRWNMLASKITETRTKLRQFMNGEGQYANLPQYVYTKAADFNVVATAAEMNTMDIFGGSIAKVLFEPGLGTSTAPTGYTTKNWRKSLSEDAISGLSSGFASYFEVNKKELFPLHTDIINENYKIKQDYGY